MDRNSESQWLYPSSEKPWFSAGNLDIFDHKLDGQREGFQPVLKLGALRVGMPYVAYGGSSQLHG